MASLIERYENGDRERVWFELRQLGGRVREHGYRESAEAVAKATVRRARANVETIVARLTEDGFQFGSPEPDLGATTPIAPPDADTPEFVSWLEGRFGMLPIVVREWILEVGDVSLQGIHPKWDTPGLIADPLMIEFEYKAWPNARADRSHAKEFFENERDAWEDTVRELGPSEAGIWKLDFAPDALHKANISGGEPYGVYVPDDFADGTVEVEDVKLSFVEYVRLCFRWGGFPGFASHSRNMDGGTVRELREGLLPL